MMFNADALLCLLYCSRCIIQKLQNALHKSLLCIIGKIKIYKKILLRDFRRIYFYLFIIFLDEILDEYLNCFVNIRCY